MRTPARCIHRIYVRHKRGSGNQQFSASALAPNVVESWKPMRHMLRFIASRACIVLTIAILFLRKVRDAGRCCWFWRKSYCIACV